MSRHPQKSNNQKQYSKVPIAKELLRMATGRWREILIDAGIPAEYLDRAEGSCPKCGGNNRFSPMKDHRERGAVHCRGCFNKETQPSPGDGLASLRWCLGCDAFEAKKWLHSWLLGRGGESALPPVPKPDKPTESKSNNRWDDLLGKSCQALTPEIAEQVAKDLGISAGALHALRAGWIKIKWGRDESEGTIVFPMMFADTTTCGLTFRNHATKEKRRAKGSKNGLTFDPEILTRTVVRLYVVESQTDCAAAVALGLDAVAIPSAKQGLDLLCDLVTRVAPGELVVVGDNDDAGRESAEAICNALHSIVAVRVIFPPQGKKDFRDWVAGGADRAAIEAAADAAELLPVVKRKPIIVVQNKGANIGEVTSQVVEGLGKSYTEKNSRQDHRLFTRGGKLVEPIESEDIALIGQLKLRLLPKPILMERIAQSVSLVSDGEEPKPLRPPSWLVEAIYERGHYDGKIPPVVGVIESPTIRPDGSILQEPGYDRYTGLICRPSTDFPEIPDSPSLNDARQALSKLCEIAIDFPFAKESDKSAWLSLLLTAIGRSCIDGCVPCFAIDGNCPGVGKGLLTDATLTVPYGRPISRQTFTNNEQEMRKKVTAIALEALPVVLLDNLNGPLGGSVLDEVLTARSWNDRRLGASEMTGDLPLNAIWIATGNNLTYSYDTSRRVLPIRLKTNVESPEERGDFVHDDLLKWVSSERASLVTAALTMLRAYFVAGCPMQPGGEWGSYEQWSAKIRGCIVWAGAADPLRHRGDIRQADKTLGLLEQLLRGIAIADPNNTGLTVAEIQRKTFGVEAENPDHEVLRAAVVEICGDAWNSRRVGKRLSSLKGRIWRGFKLDSDSAGGGVVRWRVFDGEGGFSGLVGLRQPILINTNRHSEEENEPILRVHYAGSPNPPNPPKPTQDHTENGDPSKIVRKRASL